MRRLLPALVRYGLALLALLENTQDRLERRHHRITVDYLASCQAPAMTTRAATAQLRAERVARALELLALPLEPWQRQHLESWLASHQPEAPREAPTPGHPPGCSCGECAHRLGQAMAASHDLSGWEP